MRNGKEKMPLNLHENNKFVRMDEKVKNRNCYLHSKISRQSGSSVLWAQKEAIFGLNVTLSIGLTSFIIQLSPFELNECDYRQKTCSNFFM